MQTWEAVSAAMSARRAGPPPGSVTVDERAYTDDGDDLVELLRDLPADAGVVAVVGHNPAMEELVSTVTGSFVRMKTSCIAVLEVPGDWVDLGRPVRGTSAPRVVAAGRPADGPL